jgi:hypothetical protein
VNLLELLLGDVVIEVEFEPRLLLFLYSLSGGFGGNVSGLEALAFSNVTSGLVLRVADDPDPPDAIEDGVE